MATVVPSREVRTFRAEVREVGWRVGVGAGVGVLAGYLVIGPLARLVMALLRVTSPAVVIGVTSDDGFTIGRVSMATLALLFICASLGGVAGVAYTYARIALPQRGVRLALWTVLSGALGGAVLVHDDGVDFVLLTPTWLAVGGFIALPALGGLLIALVVDRVLSMQFSDDRTKWAVPLAALLAPPAAVAAAAAGGLLLALGLVPSTPWLPRLARVALVAFAILLIALGLADLVRDVAALT